MRRLVTMLAGVGLTGITLAVDPSKLEKTLDPRAIGDEVARALAHFLAPETDHADRRHRAK